MTLKDLKSGETAVITDITLGGAAKRRLRDMGVDVGAKIKMLRRAPLGDPMEFLILGYRLCIRKKDAAMIFIERIGISSG